jgi:hypothetical protein
MKMETRRGVKFNVMPLGEYVEKEKNEETVVVLQGPLSPMISTKTVIDIMLGKKIFHHLARVQFLDDHMLQQQDGDEGTTGYDILLFVREYKNANAIGLFIDMGSEACPIALWFNNDRTDEIAITDVYRNMRDKGEFLQALTDDDIEDLMVNVNSNPRCYVSKGWYKALDSNTIASQFKP